MNFAIELTLIRHGQTQWNQEGLVQGQIDIPLSEPGRRQAELLARRLSQASPPDALLSSDLLRARHTAEYISKALRRDLKLVPELRERSYGSLEGSSWKEARGEMRNARAEGMSLDHWRPAGGETHHEFRGRILNYVESLGDCFPNRRVWLVTHGGCIRVLLHGLTGLTTDRLASSFQAHNTGVTVLRKDEAGWVLVLLNDASHLNEADQEALVGNVGHPPLAASKPHK